MFNSYRLPVLVLMTLIHTACSGGDVNVAGASKQILNIEATGAGTIVSSPSGQLACNAGKCSGNFKAGTPVMVTALAASGNTFAGWSGACVGSSATCTVVMDSAKTATAVFVPIHTCLMEGATELANMATDGAGKVVSNQSPNRLCPKAHWGQVNGICYGEYAVQVNGYGTPPANTKFSMWAQNPGCWGIHVDEPANPKFVYWNAPIVTRGFSMGYTAPLTPSGGISVSGLNSRYGKASVPCPAQASSSSVCIKWSLEVPGISSDSVVNTAANTYGNWDAMIDIYFHSTPSPAPNGAIVFDLQIYQMLMDWQAGNGPNWATNILHKYSIKTISGVSYLVTVNTQNPGTEGSNWVGNGGTLNAVSMFPLPTYPTSKAGGGAGSYLWGTPSAVHDVGGIIGWLSQTQTVKGVVGIFDDAGNPLFDNVRKENVATPLLSPAYYLTGINAGIEVIQANASGVGRANNAEFRTTDYWVALPGETVGK